MPTGRQSKRKEVIVNGQDMNTQFFYLCDMYTKAYYNLSCVFVDLRR